MAEITAQSTAAHRHYDAQTTLSIENQKLAMWLYLASEVVIFSILIGGYAVFRVYRGDAVALVQDTLGIVLVTINTFILLASSYAMVMGLRAMESGNKQGFYRWIGLTALMGTICLGGQFIEYSELQHLGITLEREQFSLETPIIEETLHIEESDDSYLVEFENPNALASLKLDEVMVTPEEGEAYALGSKFENSTAQLTPEEFEVLEDHFSDTLANTTAGFGMRFYAPTAFHGLHVLVGVLWALLVLWRGSRGRYDNNTVGIEIFGLYWHFVDVVWILLFTLIYLI
jgi:heme/copper-type cytochrome/quinol oxidase subunit 3